jgi:hypothetical protein
MTPLAQNTGVVTLLPRLAEKGPVLQRLPSGEARALAFEPGVPSGARLAGQ